MAAPTPERIERYKRDENERRKYAAWMHRTAKAMPALAARVWALRNTGYMGCGFQWSMERRLGNAIASVNNFEGDVWHGKNAVANRLITEILVEALYRDVAKAERSAKTLAAGVESEDDGCPKGDPECLGNNGDCHDACEGPA